MLGNPITLGNYIPSQFFPVCPLVKGSPCLNSTNLTLRDLIAANPRAAEPGRTAMLDL